MGEIGGEVRKLTDGDIEAIVEAMRASGMVHQCRLDGIDKSDLEAAIRFHKHMERLMTETGSTMRKTLVVFGVSGLVTLIALGTYAKIREVLLP